MADSKASTGLTSIRRSISRNVAFVGLFATGLVVASSLYWFWPERKAKVIRLSISAGSAEGLRHTIAESLADAARSRGFDIEVQGTAGSQDALKQANDGHIDLALTQGGLPPTRYPNLRQAAVLHVEPLHLLIKPELAQHHDRIHALHGQTINISTPGSGTHALAVELLRFIGIDPGSDCEVSTQSYAELLADDMTLDELPDAIFTVSSLPSPVAWELIQRHGLELAELPLADAFRLDWRAVSEQTTPDAVARRRVVHTTIPAYTYSVDPPVPQAPTTTLGTRLQLVVNTSVKADSVERLVDAVYDSSFSTTADPPLTIDLLTSAAEFPRHPGVETYVRRKTPVITERVVELTEQVLAIFGAVCGGLLFIWQAILMTRRKRRDRQFLSCIERVVRIEEQALRFETDPSLTVDDLVRIQSELSAIKNEMIAQFQKGDIDGADALSAFLNHVNDASELLTRIILHERSPKQP
ncbi:MAG: TAXI family TRAP transporter solute-binding subunit [Planctomycetota bacterium]|jgi:TRAP-type uncharacterized transport system substrate-binding protein